MQNEESGSTAVTASNDVEVETTKIYKLIKVLDAMPINTDRKNVQNAMTRETGNLDFVEVYSTLLTYLFKVISCRSQTHRERKEMLSNVVKMLNPKLYSPLNRSA